MSPSQALASGYPPACIKAPCLPDGRCVASACAGTPVATLFGWLAPVMDYWARAFRAALTDLPQVFTFAASTVKQKGLPAISAAFAALVTPAPAEALTPIPEGGCACKVWPGYVVCPKCANSRLCTCPGECVPIPVEYHNC